MTLTPTHGARLELSLESGGETALYRVEARTPEAAFIATARLDAAGVHVEWQESPPKWIVDSALGLLRTLHKNHLEDRKWPSRLHRWRQER